MASRAVVTCKCGSESGAQFWEGGVPIAEYRHIIHSESAHNTAPEFPIRSEIRST